VIKLNIWSEYKLPRSLNLKGNLNFEFRNEKEIKQKYKRNKIGKVLLLGRIPPFRPTREPLRAAHLAIPWPRGPTVQSPCPAHPFTNEWALVANPLPFPMTARAP
jgi:hypothetical protein